MPAAAVWGGGSVERFGVVILDTKHRVLRATVLSGGGGRSMQAWFTRGRCSALVLFHNHPSGDPTPSAADVALTARAR